MDRRHIIKLALLAVLPTKILDQVLCSVAIVVDVHDIFVRNKIDVRIDFKRFVACS